uniref:Uncharacterized protein n=1 Tax=Anopheles dirus TaxID=7168 RepID=A0A182NY14_9DIPT
MVSNHNPNVLDRKLERNDLLVRRNRHLVFAIRQN